MQMAKNVASLPFVYKKVPLMPDVHLGKGALVGSVIATEDAVIPAAVGVDIGCGMAAIKTPYQAAQLEGKLKQIRSEIEATIPVGFEQNKEADKMVTNWQNWRNFKDLHKGVQKLEGKALKQMGSLGGGNHFIEVCLDTENQIWLMLHSGSRHIGNKVISDKGDPLRSPLTPLKKGGIIGKAGIFKCGNHLSCCYHSISSLLICYSSCYRLKVSLITI